MMPRTESFTSFKIFFKGIILPELKQHLNILANPVPIPVNCQQNFCSNKMSWVFEMPSIWNAFLLLKWGDKSQPFNLPFRLARDYSLSAKRPAWEARNERGQLGCRLPKFRGSAKKSFVKKMSARPPTSTMATDKPKAVEIPEIVVDPNSKRRYERGRFLGKVSLLQFVCHM